MAILSKILEEDDMNHLTITDTFITEPFAYVKCGKIKVKDEQGSIWMFEYKIKSRNKRVFSGRHWNQFLENNRVRVGHKVDIDYKEPWCAQADYKIEVIKTGF
ncbi:hypothetical protein CRYUN_Cryun06bG0012100 [Craigia yunnanensis]